MEPAGVACTSVRARSGRVEELFQHDRRVARNERGDVLADDLVTSVAEELFCGRVPARDVTFEGRRDDRVERRANDGGELCLGSRSRSLLTDVPHGGDDESLARVLDRGEADVERELAAVAAPA